MSAVFSAKAVRPKDIVEVQIEECRVISVKKVAGQLKNRKNYLIEVKVSPISGPWKDVEGSFIVESNDPIPVVRKFTTKEQRKESLRKFLKKIKDRLFGSSSLNDSASKKEEAPWT